MKRFTETGKWTDPWYHRLSPGMKLLWNYLCDNCDAAGVIDLDLDIAAFHIGVESSKLDVSKFGDRIEKLACGKYWLPKFVKFQYGKLSSDCKAHNPALNSLRQYGLEERVLIPFPKGIERDKETEKEKDKEKDTHRPREIWWPECFQNDEDFRQLFTQWEDHQRARGYAFSPQSRRATLQKLANAGIRISKAVIERSLGENSGFLLWDEPKKNGKAPAEKPAHVPNYETDEMKRIRELKEAGQL